MILEGGLGKLGYLSVKEKLCLFEGAPSWHHRTEQSHWWSSGSGEEVDAGAIIAAVYVRERRRSDGSDREME